MEYSRRRAPPYNALGNLTLEEFQDELSKSELNKITEILFPKIEVAIKRKKQARIALNNLSNEVLAYKIRALRDLPSMDYSDYFEEMVCKRLDLLEEEGYEFPDNKSRLAFTQEVIQEELRRNITDEDVVEYLAEENEKRMKTWLEKVLSKGLEKINNPDDAITFVTIMFELDQRKTDDIRQNKIKFEDILVRAISGESVNLITMLCLINKYDNKGGYESISDLFAYAKNPELKLKPVPKIIQEMLNLVNLLQFNSIKSNLTIFVADTDYTETGRYGSVTAENLENIKLYVENLVNYSKTLSDQITIIPFSEISKDDSQYKNIKSEIVKNLTSFRDPDFDRDWNRKFQEAVDKIAESQKKKKLFPENQIRQKSLEITRNIWACNAAEGSVFCNLGKNIIFVSTEKRERDENYVINKWVRDNLPPVLYVLQTTQDWYRITGK